MNSGFRKYFLLTIFTFIHAFVFGQQANKPVVNPAYPTYNRTPFIGTNMSAGTPLNYIRSWTMKLPVTNGNSIPPSTLTYQQSQVTDYFDGLGRPLQQVSRWLSGGNDMVSMKEYDEFGRMQYRFLPFGSTTSTGNFDYNPFTNITSFYASRYKDAYNQPMIGPDEHFLYEEVQFEQSPLNRIIKSMPAGNSWAGSGKGIEFEYLTNITLDNVIIWRISNNALTYLNEDVTVNIPTVQPTQNTYPENSLFKKVTKNEDGGRVIEYTTKSGKLILRKVQVEESVQSNYTGYTGWLSTFYIYDDFGRLRFVIPPKAVEAIIANGWIINNAAVVNELCFRYEYDHRNRLVAKKVPGAAWVYSIYDSKDRLVATQDGKQREKNQWVVNLYDELDRLTMTGFYISSKNPSELQEEVTGRTITPTNPIASNLPTDLVISSPGSTGLQQAIRSITFDNGFESGTTIETNLDPRALIGNGETVVIGNVTSNKYPFANPEDVLPLTYTFYDDYSWSPQSYTTEFNGLLPAIYAPYIDAPPSTASKMTHGLPTGSKIRVLEDNDHPENGRWNNTVSYYDNRGRSIQSRQKTFDGSEITTVQRLGFDGTIYSNLINTSVPQHTPEKILTTTSYYYNTYNNLPSNKYINGIDVGRYSYSLLNQLLINDIGHTSDVGENGSYANAETEVHNYNIRGWLTGMNKALAIGVNQGSPNSRWFGYQLRYENGMLQKNSSAGNIAGQIWRTAGSGISRSYGYTYDISNRLLGADFSEMSNGVFADNSTVDFDVVLGDGLSGISAYDANGNIQNMTHKGLWQGSSKVIDNLLYTYTSNSNKLLNVVDRTNDQSTSLGDFRTAAIHPQFSLKNGITQSSNPSISELQTIEDYTYDINGNLVQDKNKGIISNASGAIQYNHLNLPTSIAVTGRNGSENYLKGIITYTYDALGSKISKLVQEYPNSSTQTKGASTATYYIAGSVFENNKLQFTQIEEGRLRAVYDQNGQLAQSPAIDYFLKDHLGNVRVVV